MPEIMKTKFTIKLNSICQILSVICAAAIAPSGFAQLTIPNANGSDGVLNITNDTTIDLSQAVTGSWTNTSASPGNGTYDATQWAIVFKYSSVNINPGVVVTFANHYSHAPVVWLVSSNVEIDGELSLDGQPPINGYETDVVEPGPGGFRGGSHSSLFGVGNGFGPFPGYYSGYYGTTNIVPLIGGSGGQGSPYQPYSGSGGGGAILIAASGSITVNGYSHANSGNPAGGNAYGGSGGAIRLVADQILGNGTLKAVCPVAGSGGAGKIRLEANSVASTLLLNPSTAGVKPANPALIFPPTNWPTATVLSVAGLAAPTDPKAIMSPDTGGDDLTIATVNPVTIQVQTKNFPTNGTVNVYITPRNGTASIVPASFVSGNTNQALWQVSATLPYPTASQGHTIIMARAVSP